MTVWIKRILIACAVFLVTLKHDTGSAQAQEMPEFEGVYARMESGDLMPLDRLLEVRNLPEVRLGQSQKCSNCIPVNTLGISTKVLPIEYYGSAKRVTRSRIVGFVIKSRQQSRKIFLDMLVELSGHVSGQELKSNPRSSRIGTPFEYVMGAYLDGRPTRALDTSTYRFAFPEGRDVGNHPPEKLPPHVALADCGNNELSKTTCQNHMVKNGRF